MIGCAIFWGSPIPLIEDLSARWDALTLGVVRYAIALPLVYLIASGSLGWHRPPLRPGGVPLLRLIALGSFGLSGFAVFFIVAIANTDAGTAAVIAAMAPVTSGLVALFYGEKPSLRLLIAVALAVTGAAVAAVDFDSDGALFEFRGGEALFILTQAIWAWYSIGCRRAMPDTPPAVATLATMLPAAVTLLLFWLLLQAFGLLPPLPHSVPSGDYFIIAFLAFGGTGLAIVFWNFGVAGLGLLASAMHMNLIPLFVVLTAYALGSDPRWEQIFGGSIVIVGVLQAQLGFLKARRRRAN